MTGALSRGLTLRDFDDMSIGQIVDFCIAYNEIHGLDKYEEQENKTKIATQDDFDNF